MTDQQFETLTLPNGLRVIVQSMTGVQSAALTLMSPAGACRDRKGKFGTAAILAEMLPRGAGQLSTRELSSVMDNLGLQRSVGAGVGYVTLSAATTADRLTEAVPFLADMMLKPHLADDQFEPSRELAVQSLMAIEDDPRQKLGGLLRQCSYPAPLGNPPDGELADLPAISVADIRQHHQHYMQPSESVLGFAGNVTMEQLQPVIEKYFNDWENNEVPSMELGSVVSSPMHIEHDSAQTNIGLAWDSVPYPHERYFEAWATISLLSGGMSSRLFTEVREKRGLCYAINASINTQKEHARVFGYAGTTNERAQETLDVMVAEIGRLAQDITIEELDRCKARAKSGLIMQQESTMSRSGSLARDMLFMDRVVELEEVKSKIDSLTVQQVTEFAIEYAPKSMALVTIGPEALNSDCLPT
ncbi:MAG: pitrilysin family protein [Fuerstiella sp.]